MALKLHGFDSREKAEGFVEGLDLVTESECHSPYEVEWIDGESVREHENRFYVVVRNDDTEDDDDYLPWNYPSSKEKFLDAQTPTEALEAIQRWVEPVEDTNDTYAEMAAMLSRVLACPECGENPCHDECGRNKE
jgi:hypothetical protein